MRKERVRNAVTMSLGSSAGASDTTINVTGASGLPSNGDFRLVIGNEILLGTARTGNTVTVVRGMDDTSGASHASTSNVAVILTACGVRQMLSDSMGPLALIDDPATRVPITASELELVGVGSTDIIWDNKWGGISMRPEPWTGSRLRCALLDAPATPWTLQIKMQLPNSARPAVSGGHTGIALYDSVSGRVETLSFRHEEGMAWHKWNSTLSYSGTRKSFDFMTHPPGVWLKMADTGTNLEGHVSLDGLTWFDMGTYARTDFLTNGPDQSGFYCTNLDYNFKTFYHLTSWKLS